MRFFKLRIAVALALVLSFFMIAGIISVGYFQNLTQYAKAQQTGDEQVLSGLEEPTSVNATVEKTVTTESAAKNATSGVETTATGSKTSTSSSTKAATGTTSTTTKTATKTTTTSSTTQTSGVVHHRTRTRAS